MSNTLSTSGIAGTDGITPIYQPNARWTIWNLNELYMGQTGQNRYVPNVNDYVVNPATNEQWKVISIDPTTLVPRLDPVVTVGIGSFTEEDMLLGVGPGTQSDTYRVYIDKSVQPHTLAVDARLHVAGSMCRTAQIFKGSQLDGTSKLISAFYDQSGNVLGQAIPLELVAIQNINGQNVSIRTVPVCYTTEDLVDGEVVTVVFYSDTGFVVSKRQLLVENTAFIRSPDSSVKYITSIAMESPFLSLADPKLIQYPLNVPLSGLGLIGLVNYSDGSTIRLPVDGIKFSIYGFENYAATIIGQKFPLILKYLLSSDEVVYGANVGDGKFITVPYNATTISADGQYTDKLFGYPVWIDATNGYRMAWWLYSLERNVVYDATPYVKINTNSPAFNPTTYGVRQHLSVSVNLNDVNGSYPKYIHVQTIDVVLMGPGTDRTNNNWQIGFDPNQDPLYGIGLALSSTFVNQNLETINVSCGATTVDDWLNKLYYATKPLVDPVKETVPPVPDFFSISVNGQDIQFPVTQWNSTLQIPGVLQNSSTAFIKFFKRTSNNDIQLAICGLPVYQTN
jgi:hypothetical protein